MLFPDALKLELQRNPTGAVDFKLGPVEVKGIDLPWLKTYQKDQVFLEECLAIYAHGREIMFGPGHVEEPMKAVEILQEIETSLRTHYEKIGEQGSKQGKLLASLLLLSADDVQRCWGRIADAYQADQGQMELDARILDWALMAKFLGPTRLTVYHVLTFMLSLLPPTNPVRKEAAERLAEGFRVLRDHKDLYKITDENFDKSGWTPHTDADAEDPYMRIFAA